MKRPRKSISFEMPGPRGAHSLEFETHERVEDIEVGYDIDSS